MGAERGSLLARAASPASFAVIFGVNGLGFVQFDRVQMAAMRCDRFRQALPYEDDQVFGGGLHVFGDKIHVKVQVAVIQVVGGFFFDEFTQFFGIHDETGKGMGAALHRDVQSVVVAMPVFVGAFAKHGLVFLIGPLGHPKFVGGVKTFYSGQINHRFAN